MWDLTVDGAHSFFVGPGAVLVHNFCPGSADFVSGPNGVVVPTSKSELISDLRSAGWASRPATGGGEIFTDPATGNEWRIMDGSTPSGPDGPRLIVTDARGNPVGVTGANMTGNVNRDLWHLELNP